MKSFTHTGYLLGDPRRPKGYRIKIKLRKTKNHWIDEFCTKYRKSTGVEPGHPWPVLRLDLDTIKEIEE